MSLVLELCGDNKQAPLHVLFVAADIHLVRIRRKRVRQCLLISRGLQVRLDRGQPYRLTPDTDKKNTMPGVVDAQLL